MKKFLYNIWFEILLGIVILYFIENIKWFLLYLLIVIVYRIDYIRKMIRVFQTVNDARFISIMRKLKISEEEGKIIGNEIEDNLTESQKDSLYRDINSLGL